MDFLDLYKNSEFVWPKYMPFQTFVSIQIIFPFSVKEVSPNSLPNQEKNINFALVTRIM